MHRCAELDKRGVVQGREGSVSTRADRKRKFWAKIHNQYDLLSNDAETCSFEETKKPKVCNRNKTEDLEKERILPRLLNLHSDS